MTARLAALLAALAALTFSLVLKATDDRPQRPQRDVREAIPFVIDGRAGYRCDVEITSNAGDVDEARADCETETAGG